MRYIMTVFGMPVKVDPKGLTFDTCNELYEKLLWLEEVGLDRAELHLQPYAVNQAKKLSLVSYFPQL